MREESAPPGGLGVAGGPGYDLGRQAPHRAAPTVEQPRLAGQGLPLPHHPDDVAAPPAQPARGEHDHVAAVSEHLGDVTAQPARGVPGVQFGLDHDPAADDVETTGEAQSGGHLRLPAARLGHLETAELILHQSRQRHTGHPATGWPGPVPVPHRQVGVFPLRRRNRHCSLVALGPTQAWQTGSDLVTDHARA